MDRAGTRGRQRAKAEKHGQRSAASPWDSAHTSQFEVAVIVVAALVGVNPTVVMEHQGSAELLAHHVGQQVVPVWKKKEP